MKISKILAEKYNISVRSAKQYLKQKHVMLDKHLITKDIEYLSGEIFLDVKNTEIDGNVKDFLIAEYENIVFFDKPAGMHTERHKPDDPVTISDIAGLYYPEFRLISRLDFSTDGVIAAINRKYEPQLIKKTYLAVVCGVMKNEISADFVLDAAHRKLVKIKSEHGGNKTLFSPLKTANGLTLVKAELQKAARHQIRAYLSHLGFPILGDNDYGGKQFRRIMLHCEKTVIDNTVGESHLTNQFISELFF